MEKKVTVGVIGHVDHGKTTLSAVIHTAEDLVHTSVPEEYKLPFNGRSLADAILDVNAQLAKKPQSARALRRAEARKLKPEYK